MVISQNCSSYRNRNLVKPSSGKDRREGEKGEGKKEGRRGEKEMDLLEGTSIVQ